MKSPKLYFELLIDRIVRKKYTKHSLSSGLGTAILMFHHVAESRPNGVSSSCFCSIKEFEQLIKKNNSEKHIVSISDLCSDLEAGHIPCNKIVYTFDDVPSDVFNYAIPILRQYSAPFTLYISIDLIDKEGYLSREQLEELSKDPLCTIGSHTISHCMMKKKNIDLHKEVYESKNILEEMLHQDIEHFAYPYGTPFAISRRIIKYVKKSGLYRSAVCTIPAFINQYSITNMYSLPRIHSQLYIDAYANTSKQTKN